MRVAILVLPILIFAVPAHASKTCLSQSEARRQFGAVHLYWHGPDHCWNATPVRREAARRSPDGGEPPHYSDRKPAWRDAMSEMLPETTAATSAARDSRPAPANDAPASTDWRNRWVDVAQVVPPIVHGRKIDVPAPATPPLPAPRAEPMVTANGVILTFLGLVLMLAVIELVFRNSINERRK